MQGRAPWRLRVECWRVVRVGPLRRAVSAARRLRLMLSPRPPTSPTPTDTTIGLALTIGLHKAALRGALWWGERTARRQGDAARALAEDGSEGGGSEGAASAAGGPWWKVLLDCGSYGEGPALLRGGTRVWRGGHVPLSLPAAAPSSWPACTAPHPPPACRSATRNSPFPTSLQATLPPTVAGASSWQSG